MDAGRLFGQGMSFPPRVGTDGRLAWSVGEQNVRESIRLILLTQPGERLMREGFGCGLRQFLFEPNTVATRQLIRERLTSHAWESESQDAAGTLTLVYDHHRPQLSDRLTELQHRHTDLVVSTLHAHLTHDLCLEVIILRGPARQLQEIASQLKGMKGVYKGELVMASAEHK